MKKVSGNMSNIFSILQIALQVPHKDLKNTIKCVCKFAMLSYRIDSIAFDNLLYLASPYIDNMSDPALQGEYLQVLAFTNISQDSQKSHLLDAMRLFKACNNVQGQGMLSFLFV